MSPFVVKLLLGFFALLVSCFVVSPNHKEEESGIPKYCSNEDKELHYRKSAQDALNAIGSKKKLTPSKGRAARGQHVFNNGLLGFHRSVLQDLLRDVGGYDEQLNNLMQDLISPSLISVEDHISSMVAHFSWDEFYVDFNADLFGEYVRMLRNATVIYLKAETSPNKRHGIKKLRQHVQFIANEMVNHEVYVDPMARDRWLHMNQNHHELYDNVRRALRTVFQEILQDFRKVANKIYVFRRRNKWNWDKK